MGEPPTQQPTPPATHMPPPRTVAYPKPTEREEQHSDMFLDMLQGPSITLFIGPTLPIALLCAHSIYFRNEIMHVLSTSSKKRKLSAETSDCEPQSVNREMLLTLHDMDVDIFSLFLKYIYKGTYPASVDAPLTATMAKGGMYVSRFAGSSYMEGRKATTPSSAAFDSIPPSIHAWLLAQRLRSVSFMNHAITHIYHGIGRHFALTPGLVDYVWVHTAPCSAHTATTPPSPSSSVASITPPPTPTKVDDDAPRSCDFTTPKVLAVVTPSPLRALVLSFLVTYWPAHGNHIIARNQQSAWDALFDKHLDLRRNLIFGLQEGGKLMSVQGYFAQSQGRDVVVKQEGGEVKTAV